jgi:DNA polymerase-1
VNLGEKTSAANNKKTGHTKGAVYTKVALIEFNPRSRDHIANRLKWKYDWAPAELTSTGKAKIDEKILGALTEWPEARQLAELFLIQKRLDQLAEGDEAWLKHEKNGWVHHNINPNGANGGRATHSRFNITQVPKVGSRFGEECRELFEVPPGWVLLGVDASSLELRCLAHYMSPWDDGAYGQAVVSGKEEDGTDVHSLNTQAIGLEPQKVYVISGKQQKGRNCGKTFIYAFLYGAGDEKIGITVGVSDDEIEVLIQQNQKKVVYFKKRLTKDGRKVTKKLVATCIKGALTKAKFLAKTPALNELRKKVEKVSERGYLKGLDGRYVFVRSKHSALNLLLQGAGALVCKKWIVTTEQLLLEQGLKHGWDGDFAFLIWAHDELQIAVRDGVDREQVAATARRAMKITEQFFGFKCPLDIGEPKTGRNWKETH